jgi:hypothetical protein
VVAERTPTGHYFARFGTTSGGGTSWPLLHARAGRLDGDGIEALTTDLLARPADGPRRAALVTELALP